MSYVIRRGDELQREGPNFGQLDADKWYVCVAQANRGYWSYTLAIPTPFSDGGEAATALSALNGNHTTAFNP